ncbi:hypothetical protein DH2020_048439 [Rehmannia glutinosa]|uniref:histidine kinase n=1 Tax=Rehmannia glutinosa TaxID=99300 RepID=A0ABR0U5Y7_REHGL
MSSNHKHSGSNGNVCSSYNQKQAKESLHGRASVWKWRKTLVLLWLVVVLFVFIWVLNDGKLGRNVETPLISQYNTQDVLENCNVSMEKIASFACCSGSGYGMPPSSNIICGLKMLGSENQIFHRQCELVTGERCPSIEGANANYPGLPSSDEMSASFIPNTTSSSISSLHSFCKEQNKLQMRELRSHATDHCNKGIYIRFAEICFWILIGMAISYNLCRLYDKRRSQKHKMIHQQPLLQQPQLQQQAQSSSRSTGKWRKKLLVVFVVGGDQFNVSMNHVHALAILVSTFHHGKQPSAIDQKTFEDYTERTAFERPLTSGVAYALRVRHSEREHIEKQYGWTIKKMDIDDQTLAQECNPENFSTSPVQDEYAPVIFSQKTVSHIVSIDMMSGKEDRENILRARASGKGVLTSPFKLLKSNHLGVVLTFAVYNTNLPPDAMPDERINATVGYLGASYDVPSLVEKLLHQLASKQTIIVNVYDTTSEVSPIKMFKQKPPPPLQAISAFVGVLVITLLLGHIFHAAIKQIAKVEHDYREMMELKHRAEAADVAKSQFLATVSHEIRTPMNGVLGNFRLTLNFLQVVMEVGCMLEMLMDTNLDACQLDYAQTAHDSGKDLISLINKVLDQAKIESGRLELEAVPFDPRAVLDKVLSIFSGKSHEKGIEFTHDKGHIFVSVHLADEVKSPLDVKDEVLRQSLNVVEDDLNASFNTLSGFRVVNRWKSWENFKNLGGTAEDSGNKIKLLVTVEDTGTGIPPEAQGRIFTPFMQADSSTSRKYGGTGIGLSISKRLVDLMGGEIGFESELNTGSTFSFTVPVTKAEANTSDKMWQPCDTAVSVLFQGLRALVIDGKRIRAEVTRYHLQRLGISVDITSSMESACSYLSYNGKTSVLESEQFAMVLIDQEDWDKDTCFPFHNLIKMMRRDTFRVKSGLKIFVLATCVTSTDRNKLKLDDLVDDLITKPLKLSALISTLQEATGKRLETSNKPSTLRTLLKGKQILVVDDNMVNRRVAEGALKKYGAVVTCVEGGKYAVELLKPPHKFDACFMDLRMPEMDGIEATRQIRSLEKTYNERIRSGETSFGMNGTLSDWHTPILAMTADVMQATNEACVKSGMDDYVSKPFGEGQLYSAVARFFEMG